MKNQKHLFQLPSDIHYLNCARMSPLLRSVEAAGIAGVIRKRNPMDIGTADFFEEVAFVKSQFARLIHCEAAEVAMIPSASYGLSSAMNNIQYTPGKHALTIFEEFPSGYLALRRWCDDHQAPLKVIGPVEDTEQRGKRWNERILESINADTAIVQLSAIHWMDGTKYDMESIGARCKEVGAIFVVDGTQTVGALPMDVKKYQIDALVCAGYKWLMGPYASGLAYFGEAFDKGRPIEESWMNRTRSDDFSQLTNYSEDYKPKAARYSVGESSNFILVPMLKAALEQLLTWEVENIQTYCGALTEPLFEYIKNLGGYVEEKEYRVNHLIGLRMPGVVDPGALYRELEKRKIYLSLRGNVLRISPNVYNTEADIAALMEAIDTLN